MTSVLEKVGFIAQIVICISILVAFFGTIYLLLTGVEDVAAGVREVLLVLVGVLAGAFKDVVGFYFGSSLGSAQKTQAMQQQNGQRQ